MKKIFTLLSLLFVMLESSIAAVPQEAFTFDFNIETATRVSREREEKILKALDLIRQVFASEEFRERVLKHRFGKRRRFLHNGGLSNEKIYKKILHGAEELHPYKNNTMDLKIKLYTDMTSNVIGYTRPDTQLVWVNTKYFNKRTPAEVAGNLVHEWLHKLGFDHEYHFHKNRKYSVPYAIGNLVRELAQEIE